MIGVTPFGLSRRLEDEGVLCSRRTDFRGGVISIECRGLASFVFLLLDAGAMGLRHKSVCSGRLMW